MGPEHPLRSWATLAIFVVAIVAVGWQDGEAAVNRDAKNLLGAFNPVGQR
jgi:hypothetical protein